MKKYFIIVTVFILSAFTVVGQDDDNTPEDKAGKLQERMNEYIQKKLGLSKAEAAKFRPIFLRYIVELRRVHRENKGDRPMLQLRVAELRVKARNEFREVLDEHRANRVFEHQREFEIKIREELKARAQDRRLPRGGIRPTNRLLD